MKTPAADQPTQQHITPRQRLVRWGIVLAVVVVVLLIPVPSGITSQSWRLLAIFLGTITGSILRPIPGGAVVLIGISAVAITGALPIAGALGGYADPIVWLVLAAFFFLVCRRVARGLWKPRDFRCIFFSK